MSYKKPLRETGRNASFSEWNGVSWDGLSLLLRGAGGVNIRTKREVKKAGLGSEPGAG